jgi:plasmid stabilization system protein ParE
VASYRLTRPALSDLEEVVTYLTREASAEVSERIEARLFEAFADLSRLRVLGHRRLDVRRKDLLFYVVDPYLIAFRREEHGGVMIVRVLHGRRDVGSILR